MKSIHLVFTALLLMVGAAGFGTTTDLDKNSNTDQFEIPQFEMQSVDFISYDFSLNEKTQVLFIKEVISHKVSKTHKSSKELQPLAPEPDERDWSWHSFKIKKYTYHFTARLLKDNPIRILC
jgi:hypothetical protein